MYCIKDNNKWYCIEDDVFDSINKLADEYVAEKHPELFKKMGSEYAKNKGGVYVKEGSA